MSPVEDALQSLRSFGGGKIRPGAHPSDDAVLECLARIAFSGGVIDDAELAMVSQVVDLPADAARTWIEQTLQHPADFDALSEALDTDDRRWTALRFVARMAWKDGELAPAERTFLQELATACDLGDSAMERVLREMAGPPSARLHADALRQIIDDLHWDAAQFAEGPVASGDLVPEVPDGATPVGRIGVDQAEVLGIYEEGLVARFLEGPAFLPWSAIIDCSRGAGLESSVRIHTEDGTTRSLVDARLGAIALLIDRLHRADAPEPSPRKAVRIERAPPRGAPNTFDDSEL